MLRLYDSSLSFFHSSVDLPWNEGERDHVGLSLSTPPPSPSLLQFLGSEESILEYEAERPQAAQAAAAAAAPTATATAPSALGDLIRSRDFVIDFPRVFLLNSGSVVGARETLFPARLPERSQSSLSLRQARDWMSQMSNKLEEQQGLRRLRKDEMQQVRRGQGQSENWG